MGRAEDDLWKYVIRGHNPQKEWQCKHCQRKFKGSVTRVGPHLLGIGREGIAACTGKVPDDVKREVREVLEVREVSRINIGSTSSTREAEDETRLRDEDLAPEDLVNRYGNTAFESMNKLLKVFKYLVRQKKGIEKRLKCLGSQKGKKRKCQVDHWLNEVASIEKGVAQMEKFVDQSDLANRIELEGKIRQLIEDVAKLMKQKPCEGSLMLDVPMIECAEQPLPHELIGQKTQSNIDKIWELLNDKKVKIIGVHGMGGVGKSTLVTHIHNEIAKRVGNFSCVFWVNVSQNFSISELQLDIAKRIDLILDEKYDERIRAASLRQALAEKKRSVLILDDVWKKIDLDKVGIPLEEDGIKLILTSRSLEVCRRTGCVPSDIIKVEPLSDEEAWQLFLLHLGIHGTSPTLDDKVLKIARCVARECKGLPLGIKVLATTVKSFEDVHQWRCALTKLQNSTLREQDVEEEVFKVLRFSYDRLNNTQLQECFLYCSVYPEGVKVKCDALIEKFVQERLIDGETLEEMYDEGQSILRKLVGCSLLEDCEDRGIRCVKMHDLMRDMACRTRRYMVKSGKGLKNIPSSYEWESDLEKISLMKNQIKEIPRNLSPRCHRLSTLILSRNPLWLIPDCFLLYMPALTVLDLSHTSIRVLPNSISYLNSLVSLLLYACCQLECVSPLGKLHALSTLVISNTKIKQLPQGLEKLLDLKWLNLSGNKYLELQPGSTLSNLTRLQYLSADFQCFRLQVEDLKRMRTLENFHYFFHNHQHFNDFVRRIWDKYCRPKHYILSMGDDHLISRYSVWEHCRRVAMGYECENIEHVLPIDAEHLLIFEIYQWDSRLCDVMSFNGTSTLALCEVAGCPSLKSLFCLSRSCSFCSNLQNLRQLILRGLDSLAVLWKENKEDDIAECLSTPIGGMFSSVMHLQIVHCNNMEKLLTVGMLAHLPNLVKIDVRYCQKMKEIISDQASNEESSSSQGNFNVNYTKIIRLPKLEELKLEDLKELRRVCEGIMACDSFQKLFIRRCPSLEREPCIQSQAQIYYDIEWGSGSSSEVPDSSSMYSDGALSEYEMSLDSPLAIEEASSSFG